MRAPLARSSKSLDGSFRHWHCRCTSIDLALVQMSQLLPGFGRPISWNEDARISTGHTMTFKDALHITSANLRTKLLVPSWAMPWRAQWRLVDQANKEMRVRYIFGCV